MNKPAPHVIDAVAPPHDIESLGISDGYSVRNVAQAEQRSTLRLPRGGDYDASFVAARKFYDGSGGGEAGHYALLFIEFRAAGSRWRTASVKIRAAEAVRVARDLLKGKPSKPGRAEKPRVGGKELPTNESELLGAPVANGNYVLFIRHRGRSGEFVRTRGVEILDVEKTIISGMLTQLGTLKGKSE